MLLRTSTNPISQALLSTVFPDSPSKRDLFMNAAAASSAFSPGDSAPAASSPRYQIFCTKSKLGSPRFNMKPGDGSLRELRRALSDSNLEDLGSPPSLSSFSSCSSFSPYFQRSSEGPRNAKKLETAPSFSIYRSGSGSDLEALKELEEKKDVNEKEESGSLVGGDDGALERTATIGEVIEAIDGLDFCFGRTDMGLIAEEAEDEEEDAEEKEVFEACASPRMYLATGLGADIIPGADHLAPDFQNKEDAEEYYRKLVEEFPNHPLLLRNYAELLKSKGHLKGAEDFYLRATLVDPEDGEILSQYAQLVWEVHHDKQRAGEYFERAAKASPQDSHVLGAVASFHWETHNLEIQDLDQSKEGMKGESRSSSMGHEDAIGAGIAGGEGGSNLSAGGNTEGSSVEEYYKQLVEQNPSNAIVLRNYAHFLYKSNKDLQGAEVYYSRAILADPEDGEILSEYANLVWELYQDAGKAGSYFEQAVEAAPADSHVLAAYASFLWATGEEEENEENNEAILLPSVQTQLPLQVMPIECLKART